MNEINKTIKVKKMSKYQMLKTKMQQKIMHVLTVSIVLGTVTISNASATTNNSTIDFSGVVDTIEAVTPIFGALQDLVVAIVPYIMVLLMAVSLVTMVEVFFKRKLF